jgi:hypothetical protein
VSRKCYADYELRKILIRAISQNLYKHINYNQSSSHAEKEYKEQKNKAPFITSIAS